MINIFLSWSGLTGKLIATKLRDLLKTQIRGTKPFMSDFDIEKGKEWKKILDESLLETRYGMFIITPDAHNSVWMGYETGAVSIMKEQRKIDIFPLLFDGQGAIPNYLSEYQGIEFEKEKWQDIFFKIVKLTHEGKDENLLDINNSFDFFWRIFNEDIQKILKESENIKKSKLLDSKEQEESPQKLMKMLASIESAVLSNNSFDKILGIEKKIDNLFDQLGDFQSRLTPALHETGFLRIDSPSQYPTTYPSNRRSISIRRLKDIISYIQRNDLLDENTFKELNAVLVELES